jgi:hypothetical protein
MAGRARSTPRGTWASICRACAASPTSLRRCAAGETGAVLSRYNRVAGFDWLAMPLIPYLYAVERAKLAPSFADAAEVGLVGASYDRRTIAITLPTTAEQDDRFIRAFNDRRNTARFNLLFRNCADFARDVINSYYPKALRSGVVADLGLTTPKHIARSLARFGARNPDLQLTAFVIPQIPGSRRESGNARGVLESLVKTKKYAIPLAIVQPWLPVGFAAGYLATGRFDAGRLATMVYQPRDLEREALLAAVS